MVKKEKKPKVNYYQSRGKQTVNCNRCKRTVTLQNFLRHTKSVLCQNGSAEFGNKLENTFRNIADTRSVAVLRNEKEGRLAVAPLTA